MVSVTARPHAWRRMTLALVGVAAILVCLLAMSHGTVTPAGGSPGAKAAPTSTAFAEQLLPTADPGGAAPTAEQCGATCLPADGMVATACILVLLAAVAVAAVDLLATRWSSVRGFLVALTAHAGALVPPAPPSLHILSVSRT